VLAIGMKHSCLFFLFSHIPKIDRQSAKRLKTKNSFLKKQGQFPKRKYQQKLKTDVALNETNLKPRFLLFTAFIVI
jgi:hypothetical protein